MNAALDWLQKHHEDIIHGLAELVAIPSISTDGEHDHEIGRTAALTCDLMRDAGLQNVETLKVGNSLPYAYGEWLEAGCEGLGVGGGIYKAGDSAEVVGERARAIVAAWKALG